MWVEGNVRGEGKGGRVKEWWKGVLGCVWKGCVRVKG